MASFESQSWEDGTQSRCTPGSVQAAGCVDSQSICRAKLEWESVVDALPQLVFAIDQDGRVLRVNRSYEHWRLGRVTAVRGQSVDVLLHGHCDDAQCYLKRYMADALNEVSRGLTLRLDAEDRRLGRVLNLTVMPIVAATDDFEPAAGGFAALVVEDVTELKRAESALRQSQSELRLLSAQLLTIQEMERKRIASDLHDSVCASLAAMKLKLEQVAQTLPAGAKLNRNALDGLVGHMRETLGEVRRIAMDLRPATLDDLGLVATLSWLFRGFSELHPAMRMVKDIAVTEEDIPAAAKTPIFRVLQEGLNNAVRHAAADEIFVSLRRLPGEIELVLEDRGCGFDPATKRGTGVGCGLGLNSMRDRTELSGGKFRLDSAPGSGTRLRATWPLTGSEGHPR